MKNPFTFESEAFLGYVPGGTNLEDRTLRYPERSGTELFESDALKPWPKEAEEELGPSGTPPNTASEQQLIRTAISQGHRTEDALTDRVFLRRYPKRQGRRLQRGEPGFETLRREWLTIRDRLVRPILGVDGANDLFDRAQRFYQRKQYDRAIVLYEHARNYPELDPEIAGRVKAACLFNLGQSNRLLKRFAAAAIYYENFLAQSGLSDEARLKAQRKLDEAKWGAGVIP